MPYKNKALQKVAQHNSFIKNKERIYEKCRGRKFMVWAQKSLYNHRKLKKYTIDISNEDLETLAINTTHCIYCGGKLNYDCYTSRKHMHEKPTLDRVDNYDHITKNNVQIICAHCNSTKSDRTHKEFIEYCSKIHKNFGTPIV